MSSPSRNQRAFRSAIARPPLAAVLGVPLLAFSLGAATMAVQQETIATVAVFPVENLSGGNVPAEDIRRALIGKLAAGGVKVLDDGALDDFMTRHRVRYAAGIETATAEALRTEGGVDAVVVASIELSSDAVPPKLGLTARLVSIRTTPTVVWADDAGTSGEDAPGFFDLKIVNDYQTLATRAIDRVSDSLLAYLKSGSVRKPETASKFKPKSAYRAIAFEAGTSYSVAVVPFFNLSERRNAGEVLALLFMRHLSAFPQFRVIDTGVVRRQLLDARVILEGGISLSDADTVASLIDADFVLGGRVVRYEDTEGPGGRTTVEFSTTLIEKKSRRVVWSSSSYNDGSDGVRAFERGTSRTAHAMATQMVRLTAETIAGRER